VHSAYMCIHKLWTVLLWVHAMDLSAQLHEVVSKLHRIDACVKRGRIITVRGCLLCFLHRFPSFHSTHKAHTADHMQGEAHLGMHVSAIPVRLHAGHKPAGHEQMLCTL
jgi:hypothetical protein